MGSQYYSGILCGQLTTVMIEDTSHQPRKIFAALIIHAMDFMSSKRRKDPEHAHCTASSSVRVSAISANSPCRFASVIAWMSSAA